MNAGAKRTVIRMCLAGSCIQILFFMIFSQDLPRSPRRESTCCSPPKTPQKPDKEIERLFSAGHGYGNELSSATKTGGGGFCSKQYTPAFDILKMKQPKYLSRFKNPCWLSEGRFLCIPYFHLIGVAKCGTTDLFEKIARHSEFRRPSVKEPKWLSTKRFNNDTTAKLQFYATEFFHEAAKEIEKSVHNDQLSELITGEGSINTIDGCMFWQFMPQNRDKDEPVVNNPEYIYHINPNARILINVRNPVDRLWSEYLAFTQDKESSAKKFHDIVVRAISLYNKCLEYRSLRSCMYSKRLADYSTMNDAERNSFPDGCGKVQKDIVLLRRGVYHIFIRDYLKVFPRDQILIQRLEDISENQMESLSKVFKFLDMGPVDEQLEESITELGIRNSRTSDRSKGDMLKKTRIILENFYRPHNKELAKLLNDRRFAYE